MNSPHELAALLAALPVTPVTAATSTTTATAGPAQPQEHVAAATRLLADIARDFAPVVFANSLGAEDVVLTDLIARQGLDIEMFCLDTGRLPVETYTLMETIEQRYGIALQRYHPRHEAVQEYARAHGINAFYNSVELRRACCAMRKVEPLGRALEGKRAWITGMRAQQSPTRAGLPQHQLDAEHNMDKFNPLAAWSDAQVWAYIRAHDVPYNALHDKHYPSIGCAPCTRAVAVGEDPRAGRWWWESEQSKECGLHVDVLRPHGRTSA